MQGASGTKPRSFLSGLYLRVFSALVMIPAALAAIYFGGLLFSLMIIAAALVMIYEWVRMVDGNQYSYVSVGLAIVTLFALILASVGQYSFAYLAAVFGGVVAWMSASRRALPVWWRGIASIYIIMPCIALIWLRNEPHFGRTLTFILFFVVWATDIGAYAFGNWLGGPKLNPLISPKKTWTGTLGGIFAGACVAAAFGWTVFGISSALAFYFMGGGLAVASTLGDFVESAIKREFGVKDSSGFIPGHGGMLDRLDGMIFATFAMAGTLYMYMIFDMVMGN